MLQLLQLRNIHVFHLSNQDSLTRLVYVKNQKRSQRAPVRSIHRSINLNIITKFKLPAKYDPNSLPTLSLFSELFINDYVISVYRH